MLKVRGPRFAAIAAFACATAIAGSAMAGYIFVSSVTQVGCYDSGECWVRFPTDVPTSVQNCGTVRNQGRFSLSTPGGAEMYRTALAAFLAGKRIRVDLGGCEGSYVKIGRLNIE